MKELTVFRCKNCNQWVLLEEKQTHTCSIPKYFFGPDLDENGNVWHWESDNGKDWEKKHIRRIFTGLFIRRQLYRTIY